MAAVIMMITALPVAANAADNNVVNIETADQLMDVLDTTVSEAYNHTYGKTFVLQNDITIDTSNLPTSYTTGYNPSRVFSGVLDGGGHTITVVNATGADARPLFDSIQGSQGGYYARVQNLNVVFKDNVAGTTIASHTSYVRISNVNISFEKDIVFAQNSSGYAIATGVYGFTSGGIDVRIDDVSVTAIGEAPYGIIGSKDAQNARYVMAAGIYTESNAAGGEIVCDGIDVHVRGIYAGSSFNDGGYAACCAAGVASGHYQTNANIGNVAVVIDEDISASVAEKALTDVDAYGIAYDINSIYNCSLEVNGNIESISNGGEINWGYSSGYASLNSTALGVGYTVSTNNNHVFFQADSVGKISVVVRGDIVARSQGQGSYPWFAIASGCAYQVSYYVPWNNVSIEVDGDVLSQNVCNEGYLGYSNMAYASGFSIAEEITNQTNKYDLIDCEIDVNSITAIAPESQAIACGAILQNYGICKDCKVAAKRISATGEIASAAGFSYTLNPDRRTTADPRITIDNCIVDLEELIATGNSSEAAGLICGLLSDYSNKQEIIQNCSVEIGKTLSADVFGLLITANIGKYELHNNTVTLPRSQADVITIGGVEYVRFTASELSGQAEKTDWESGNSVIFIDDSINSVTCAFDDSNTTYGTLWELNTITTFHSVQYDLNGGYASEGVDYSDVTVAKGEEITLPDAPSHDTHDFVGWHDGENLLSPGDKVAIHKDTVFTAQWEKSVVDPPYIPPAEPEEPEFTPDGLNTKDHFSYIIGYEDGTVKPNAYITRAEVATIFFRLLTDEARTEFWAESNDYTDVSAADWYNNAVSTLSKMGILGGYEDGIFCPNATITRAEFAKIAVSFFDYEGIEADNVFVDVADGAWYENYVAVAAEIGLIEGYDGDIFRPDASITRAEACTIINRTLGRAPDKDHLLPENEMNTWADNSDLDVWYYAQIQEATNSHDYSWIGDTELWTAKLDEPDWDKLQC